MLFTVLFWKSAVARALKTAAQTAVALLSADAVNVVSVAWVTVGGIAGGAALVSLLMSVSQVDSVVPGTDLAEVSGPGMADDPAAHVDSDIPEDDAEPEVEVEENIPDLAEPIADDEQVAPPQPVVK